MHEKLSQLFAGGYKILIYAKEIFYAILVTFHKTDTRVGCSMSVHYMCHKQASLIYKVVVLSVGT